MRPRALHAVAAAVTYGWGVIPVEVRLGGSAWPTSLFPKDGGYLGADRGRRCGSGSAWRKATRSRSSWWFASDRPRARGASRSAGVRPGYHRAVSAVRRGRQPGAPCPSRQPPSTSSRTTRPMGRVHIVGAGPVGLFLTALLQPVEGQRVRLYERRAGTRGLGWSRSPTTSPPIVESYGPTRSTARTSRRSSTRGARDEARVPRRCRGPQGAAARVDAGGSSRSTPSSRPSAS